MVLNREIFNFCLFLFLRLIPKYLISIVLTSNMLVFFVEKRFLREVSIILRFHSLLRFSALLDLFSVDNIVSSRRFSTYYKFSTYSYCFDVFIKITSSKVASLFSLSSIYSSAIWLEREVWDMFGIFFTDHPDLRRILTDYGFSGFPLRKDFPLSGYDQLRYDEQFKQILSESLNLSQEFRFFKFFNPWYGINARMV